MSRVMLFLGAGASTQFGVPTANGLLTEYLRDSTRPKWMTSRANHILLTLREYGFQKSLENLLTVLDSNADIKTTFARVGPILTQFVPLNKFRSLSSSHNDGLIAQNLRDWVFRKCYVSEQQTVNDVASYYDAVFVGIKKYFSLPDLSKYVRRYPLLHVFSTNFDNCVELCCRIQKIPIYDGFDKRPAGGYKFDHRLYDENLNTSQLKLYKIHGTVRYVKNPAGEFDELALAPPSGPIVINGQVCTPDLVYPGSYQYSSESPRLELLYLMKEQIRKATCIIVIGYSFQDLHVITAFREALSENADTTVVICSRNPKKILKNRLSFAKKQCITIKGDAKNLRPQVDFRRRRVPK